MTMQAFFPPDDNAILLITRSGGIFIIYLQGALCTPVYVHDEVLTALLFVDRIDSCFRVCSLLFQLLHRLSLALTN